MFWHLRKVGRAPRSETQHFSWVPLRARPTYNKMAKVLYCLKNRVSGAAVDDKINYTQESAEKAIASGDADLIAFGRPFIGNPDLVERFANNWPLSPPADVKVWSSFEPEG